MTSPGSEPASASRSCASAGACPGPCWPGWSACPPRGSRASSAAPGCRRACRCWSSSPRPWPWATWPCSRAPTWTWAAPPRCQCPRSPESHTTRCPPSARPSALAGAAWTLGMVQRSAGDTDGALTLARDAAALLEPRLEDADDELRALYGALQLHAATTAARAGREGDAWRHWDEASATAERLPAGYHHPWTMFGASNVKLHAVSIAADLSRSAEARSRAEDIDPAEIPSRERRRRLALAIPPPHHHPPHHPPLLPRLD